MLSAVRHRIRLCSLRTPNSPLNGPQREITCWAAPAPESRRQGQLLTRTALVSGSDSSKHTPRVFVQAPRAEIEDDKQYATQSLSTCIKTTLRDCYAKKILDTGERLEQRTRN